MRKANYKKFQLGKISYKFKSVLSPGFGYLRNKYCETVSHQEAINKAETEYKKYQQKTLSEVEVNFLNSMKVIENYEYP